MIEADGFDGLLYSNTESSIFNVSYLIGPKIYSYLVLDYNRL